MNSDGTAFILKWIKEDLPEFIEVNEVEKILPAGLPKPSIWKTLFVSGGRKDKISKGDIAGMFFKQGGLEKNELGIIELKQDCAFAAVPATKVDHLIGKLNNTKLKKRKIRVYAI